MCIIVITYGQVGRLKRAYAFSRLYFMGTYFPNIGGSEFKLALQLIPTFFLSA